MVYHISPDAFAAFESEAEVAFVAKLAGVLRDAVPALASEPEPAFSATVRLLIDQARGYGLASEQEIGVFAVTAGVLGLDFVDRFAGARQILEGREPPARKADLLEAFTRNLIDTLER
jgi:hypothetical protein